MLACVGYLTGAMGMTFPGDISPGTSFASVNADGVYNAWANVPQEGKLQILLLIFALEFATESKKPHYMRGGVPGRIDQLPFDGITGLWAPKIKFWDRYHECADGRREGAQGRPSSRRPPRDDRHHVVPPRPRYPRRRAGAPPGVF